MRRTVLVILLLLLLPRPDASSPAGRALVAIDNPAPSTAARLLGAGVAVLRDLGGYLVALAGPADLELLDRLELVHRVLDPDPEGKTFYVTSRRATPPGEPGLDTIARVCMESPHGSVVEATPQEAHRLAVAGVEIARLFTTPMRAAVVDKPAPRIVPAQPDSLVQAMVDSVDINAINASVQRLQDFGSRYSLGDSVLSARDWIVARFESFGIDSVTLQEFNSAYAENVIAVKPGIGHPDKLIIIGGHYDSTAQGLIVAPGADDNASGTTCVLECARVLSPYQFDYTIVFVAFCGEEQGLLGSELYAISAAARGDDIVAMVNVDMIGYLFAGDPLDLDIIDNDSSTWLRDLLMGIAPMYVPELPAIDGALPGGSRSDHESFWRHGFDAIMFWEDTDHWSPYIHSVNDVVGTSYNSPTLAHGSIKMAAALVATLAGPFHVILQHTPLAGAEDPQGMYRIDANVLSNGLLNDDSLFVRYTLSAGDVVGAIQGGLARSPAQTEFTVPLEWMGQGNAYQALIPPQAVGTVVDYYIVAENTVGFRALDPRSAPLAMHRFIVGMPMMLVDEAFETDPGWTIGAPDDDAVSGFWVREAPHETRVSTEIIQPGYDNTPDPDSVCFVTGNAPPGSSQGFRDVDLGKTTLLTPIYDLSAYANVWVRYYRWYTNDTGSVTDDRWYVDVSNDGGSSWINLETLDSSDRSWRLVVRRVKDYLPVTAQMQFRFVASDSLDSSVVEALVDDFAIISYTGAVTSARSDKPRATLAQNYPNPFNPHTTIRLSVMPPGGRVQLRVYDVAGRLVATLLEDELVTGEVAIPWNGRNRDGIPVASGVYFYRLVAPGETLTRKLVVVR